MLCKVVFVVLFFVFPVVFDVWVLLYLHLL